MSNAKLNDNDRSETISMLLTLELHRHLSLDQRALKIRKCAKSIMKRTNRKVLKNAMHTLRNSKDDQGTIDAIELVSKNWKTYEADIKR